jgi:hypothetical protein
MRQLDNGPSASRPDLLSAAHHGRLVRAGFHPVPITHRPITRAGRNVP